MKYNVHDMLELATALKAAANVALANGVNEIESPDTFSAIEEVLEYHPEAPVIGWAKKCLRDLQAGRPE